MILDAERLKQGLYTCRNDEQIDDPCQYCVYSKYKGHGCTDDLAADALEYITYLELRQEKEVLED